MTPLKSVPIPLLTDLTGKRRYYCESTCIPGPKYSLLSRIIQFIIPISILSLLYFYSTNYFEYFVMLSCSTIFAYGQTGSGKTHTMFGPPNMEEHTRLDPTSSAIGLIPRAVSDIFSLSNHSEVMQYSVLCSFVQLYNENCYDMLRYDF